MMTVMLPCGRVQCRVASGILLKMSQTLTVSLVLYLTLRVILNFLFKLSQTNKGKVLSISTPPIKPSKRLEMFLLLKELLRPLLLSMMMIAWIPMNANSTWRPFQRRGLMWTRGVNRKGLSYHPLAYHREIYQYRPPRSSWTTSYTKR